MAYVPVDATEPGRDIEIEIRDRRLRAAVVALPFYKRPRS
jgi:glycine cleavage system aminomethyltransferase T